VADNSFEPFVRANSAGLVRTAFLLTGSQPAAEDLAQDTLTHLYPQWNRVMAADAPLAYVRRSLTNRYISDRRRRSSHDEPMWDVPDGWDGRDLDARITERSATWQLLGTLPARQRAAVVLRFYHDLPDGEIASIIGARPATVRTLLSRALAALRANSERHPGTAVRTETTP
jgi:RNA polymerase sigma-70 factor (sigma-E family)